MNRLGIELLSVYGMSPVEQVRLAHECGCGHISTGLTRLPMNPFGFPDWSLRDDPALLREFRAALRDTDVSISLGEGFGVRASVDIADRAADLDLFAELGARGVGGVCMEPDLARGVDQFARLNEMAEQRGLLATIEFAPMQAVGDLAAAMTFVRQIDSPNFRLLVDAMHFCRSGGRPADLAALEPAHIGYFQLCDVPLAPSLPDYMQEAMSARLIPGEGDLPLAELLAAIPRDIPVGLEIPNLVDVKDRETLVERVRRATNAAHALLRQL